MKAGDVVRVKRIRHIFHDGRSFTEWSPASKDEVLVFLCLGHEPLRPKSSKELLDADAVLECFGWTSPNTHKKNKQARRRQPAPGGAGKREE